MEFNEGVYCYEDRSYTERYLSTLFLRMDQGDDAFEVLDKNVRSNENISLGGHDGIYFEKESLSSKKTSSHIYLAYPEVHYVLDLYIGSDIPKEEALKFAEGIRLTPTDDPEEIAKVRVEDWSDYIEREKSNEAAEKQALEETSSESEEPWLRVPTQDFEKTVHAIGESFSMYREYGIGGTPEFELDYLCYPGLDVTVNSVSVMDNVSSVSDSPFFDITPYAAEAAISEDGSLLPIPFDYIKLGNGIETTDYVVNTKKVTPKFVLAEVSYTNHGEQPLANVQVNSTLLTLREQDGSMEFCQMPHLDGYGSEWDICEDSFHLLNKECPAYFEIKNAASEKNYISNLQPGETAILVTGFFVAEEDLPYLYLNLDPYAGCYQFNETGLDIGYTDIRQK